MNDIKGKQLLSIIQETKAFLQAHFSPGDSLFFSSPSKIYSERLNSVNLNDKILNSGYRVQVDASLKKAKIENISETLPEKPSLAASLPFKPAAQENKQKEEVKRKEVIEIRTLPAPTFTSPSESSNSIEDLFSLFEKLKLLKISRDIPDDSMAKDIAQMWKDPTRNATVLLLSLKQEETFLSNLAKAMTLRLKTASVLDALQVEKEKKWEYVLGNPNLKWILCFPTTLSSLVHLKSHYRHLPATNQHFFGKVPIFFLQPLSMYLENLSLKKQLWETLCQLLK